jgi:DNA-binding transcriptional regulator LsrR (DeoR family)
MHFLDRKTNLAIATELNISRFRVARLIELALAEGLVSITVATPASIDNDLSGRLAKGYHLVDALVAADVHAKATKGSPAAVGLLAAEYLTEVMEEGATIGVTWGRTMDIVADSLVHVPRLQACEVVQMVGSMLSLELSLQASDVIRRFAEHSREGIPYLLHAPLIVSDAATAENLRNEVSVARTLAKLKELDLALVGIGSWDPPASRLVDVLPKEDFSQLKSLKIVADVGTILFDANGKTVDVEFNDRTISATPEDLRSTKLVIGVAFGREKVNAIRAVLHAGFIHTLVTDAPTARALLTALD